MVGFFFHLTYCVGFESKGYNFLKKLNHSFTFFAPCILVFSSMLIDFHRHAMIALPISLLIPIAGHTAPFTALSSCHCISVLANIDPKSILVISSSKKLFCESQTNLQEALLFLQHFVLSVLRLISITCVPLCSPSGEALQDFYSFLTPGTVLKQQTTQRTWGIKLNTEEKMYRQEMKFSPFTAHHYSLQYLS